jgi:hypothetical protein
LLEQHVINKLPGFRKRMEWFLKHRQDLARHNSFRLGAGYDPTHRLRPEDESPRRGPRTLPPAGPAVLPDEQGRRACHGDDPRHATDPHWRT